MMTTSTGERGPSGGKRRGREMRYNRLSSAVFSEFPPITNEHQRSNYKHEFDRDHQEYKDLQAELDTINKNLSDVDRELDELEEGSPQYLVRRGRS